jgi:hypothetical protein
VFVFLAALGWLGFLIMFVLWLHALRGWGRTLALAKEMDALNTELIRDLIALQARSMARPGVAVREVFDRPRFDA